MTSQERTRERHRQQIYEPKNAFEVLIANLDPPVDPQQSMVTLSREEWEAHRRLLLRTQNGRGRSGAPL